MLFDSVIINLHGGRSLQSSAKKPPSLADRTRRDLQLAALAEQLKHAAQHAGKIAENNPKDGLWS